jgi:hypothetical protein
LSLRELIKERFSISGWVKDALFGGVGAVALSMTYQFFEVLKKQPDLLLKWGPNFILCMLGITILGVLANRVVDALTGSADRLAEGQDRQIEATQRTADAQQAMARSTSEMAAAQREMAAKSSAQLDEIQTGVGYNQVQNERILTQLAEIGRRLDRTELAGRVPASEMGRV